MNDAELLTGSLRSLLGNARPPFDFATYQLVPCRPAPPSGLRLAGRYADYRLPIADGGHGRLNPTP